MARFFTQRTFASGSTFVEVGTRAGKPVLKVTLEATSAFIVPAPEANTLADLMDDALDALDTDPLLWGDGSQ
jgi:hypothetical protein